jgi:hypothetical protein
MPAAATETVRGGAPADPAAASAPAGPGRPWNGRTRLALVVSLLFIVLIAVAAALFLRRSDPIASGSAPAVRPSAEDRAGSAPPVPEPPRSPAAYSNQAYVSASLLSCRAAPAREAQLRRTLSRGQRIRIVARDGEWTSIAYRDRQCWVLSRYLSEAQPF